MDKVENHIPKNVRLPLFLTKTQIKTTQKTRESEGVHSAKSQPLPFRLRSCTRRAVSVIIWAVINGLVNGFAWGCFSPISGGLRAPIVPKPPNHVSCCHNMDRPFEGLFKGSWVSFVRSCSKNCFSRTCPSLRAPCRWIKILPSSPGKALRIMSRCTTDSLGTARGVPAQSPLPFGSGLLRATGTVSFGPTLLVVTGSCTIFLLKGLLHFFPPFRTMNKNIYMYNP